VALSAFTTHFTAYFTAYFSRVSGRLFPGPLIRRSLSCFPWALRAGSAVRGEALAMWRKPPFFIGAGPVSRPTRAACFPGRRPLPRSVSPAPGLARPRPACLRPFRCQGAGADNARRAFASGGALFPLASLSVEGPPVRSVVLGGGIQSG
jgi:hypothetical protein